ncbi:hypothetical protein NLI96_g6777 [Meripilus lineatus]|uniref:F-box domain-containing protein n=1 Tax=Meripilus lineatus TaxID=2056292 RepID=A0AAD5V0D9_9APHY|nr:hypothetical protein NLI96_g6777 [Physisporinus lineatus]
MEAWSWLRDLLPRKRDTATSLGWSHRRVVAWHLRLDALTSAFTASPEEPEQRSRMTIAQLPPDILIRISEELFEDDCLHALCSCALVNHEFHSAASRLLYRSVTLAPAFTNTINLKRRSQELNPQFIAALLPKNSAFVLELTINGFLLSRPAPLNAFSQTLKDAIQQWINLCSFTLTPSTYPSDLVETIIPQISKCSHLRELTVGSLCGSDENAHLLVQILGLESLTIQDPKSAILQLLPEWLDRLKGTLISLGLQNNCGSVTPGVLRSLAVSLKQIQSLTLGLSYSLTNDDVFSFLNELSMLQDLQLDYYMQLRPPTTQVYLPNLRSFTIRHKKITDRTGTPYLSRWIRQVASQSPIEELVLLTERGYPSGATVNLDGVVQHLRSRHHTTLRVLNMNPSYVRKKTLRKLFSDCPHLEEVGVGIHASLLEELPKLLDSGSQLRTLTLNTPMLRHSRARLGREKVEEVMSGRPSPLHQIRLNRSRWKGAWATTPEGIVEFVVEERPNDNRSTW